jgi:lipooligosaccharide transport system ATP-binding protein
MTEDKPREKSIITARALTKRFEGFVAVDAIDFDIVEGECFGFLGPNGAGKTSTMKMISCVSPVTGGQLLVERKNVRKSQRDIKMNLGVVSQADSLDPDLNVLQNLLSYGRYFNLPKELTMHRALDALELFQLRDKAKSSTDELSGGMRRRLLIARAMIHDPSVLVLDEPTTGLDPQTRLLVWEKLVLLKSQGITILLTTHYMEEAAYLCDRLVVMDSGKILVEGRPKQLILDHVGEYVLEVKVTLAEKESVMGDLLSHGLEFEDRGDSLIFYGDAGRKLAVGDSIVNGHKVVERMSNLEDVFLRLTGRGLREE